MKPLTEPEIRAAFVNCSKGEANRASIPRNLSGRPWEDLDFLGWRDPQSPERAYLAVAVDGKLVAIVLRCPGPLQKKTSMCSFCLTSHSGGVTLMVAPRTGQAGQQGNTVGDYLCTDLACSFVLAGKEGGPGTPLSTCGRAAYSGTMRAEHGSGRPQEYGFHRCADSERPRPRH